MVTSWSSCAQSLAAGLLVLTHLAHDLLQLLVEVAQSASSMRFCSSAGRALYWSRDIVSPSAVLGAKAKSGRGAHHEEAVRLGLLAQRVELRFLLLADVLGDLAALLLVLLALERLGDGRLQVLDHLLDVAPELAGPARRQADGVRLVGLGEVVDVDPVVRHRQREAASRARKSVMVLSLPVPLGPSA